MNKKEHKTQIQAGSLLIAEPFMEDPHFRRSVVLLCEHHSEGSIGFILNKPVGMNVDRLVAAFPEFHAEVFYGGPVQTDTIHYVHTKGDLIENSVEIAKGLYWGGNFEQLKFCAENGLLSPFEVRFFVGYSGWGEGQLEEEMEDMSWMIGQVDKNYLFMPSTDARQLWRMALEHEGDVYSVIGQMPMPNWN